MTVAEIMHKGVMTVQRSTNLQEVSSFFIEHGITGAPVVDEHGVPVGAISMSDATSPSPARLAELREAIAAEGVTCIFAEPQFSASSMERIAEDLDLRTGTLDPLGQSIPTGPDFYADLMEGLSASLRGCLAG